MYANLLTFHCPELWWLGSSRLANHPCWKTSPGFSFREHRTLVQGCLACCRCLPIQQLRNPTPWFPSTQVLLMILGLCTAKLVLILPVYSGRSFIFWAKGWCKQWWIFCWACFVCSQGNNMHRAGSWKADQTADRRICDWRRPVHLKPGFCAAQPGSAGPLLAVGLCNLHWTHLIYSYTVVLSHRLVWGASKHLRIGRAHTLLMGACYWVTLLEWGTL